MLSREKLLKAIDDDIKVCRDAKPSPDDVQGRDRQKLEVATLLRHAQMAHEAGDDQTKLEQVVQSLEKSPVVGYQRWWELSTETTRQSS
jgi:hypothetical protein